MVDFIFAPLAFILLIRLANLTTSLETRKHQLNEIMKLKFQLAEQFKMLVRTGYEFSGRSLIGSPDHAPFSVGLCALLAKISMM